jgi:hypothetical protein
MAVLSDRSLEASLIILIVPGSLTIVIYIRNAFIVETTIVFPYIVFSDMYDKTFLAFYEVKE